MGDRQILLKNWLAAELNSLGMSETFEIVPASSDASFRRYFRVIPGGGISYIAMDAPPEHEDCRPFIAIARAMADTGLYVPRVIRANLEMGFLLLTDLGDRQYLSELNQDTAHSLYDAAMEALLVLQKSSPPEGLLPVYSRELLLAEMHLFIEWFISGELHLEISPTIIALLENTFQSLADQALSQPQVWVHRDYHSRNLMVADGSDSTLPDRGVVINTPGILDFQDAVLGPVCYDLVSLLRDCYVCWPAELTESWVESYFVRLREQGVIPSHTRLAEFRRWFDWMGVQRHLKAIGIFSRLKLRDGKPDYMSHIPRTFLYILQVSRSYPELSLFFRWLEESVLPALISEFGLADNYYRNSC